MLNHLLSPLIIFFIFLVPTVIFWTHASWTFGTDTCISSRLPHNYTKKKKNVFLNSDPKNKFQFKFHFISFLHFYQLPIQNPNLHHFSSEIETLLEQSIWGWNRTCFAVGIMNIFRLAGDMTHLISVLVLLLKIYATKSCSGLLLPFCIFTLTSSTSYYISLCVWDEQMQTCQLWIM